MGNRVYHITSIGDPPTGGKGGLDGGLLTNTIWYTWSKIITNIITQQINKKNKINKNKIKEKINRCNRVPNYVQKIKIKLSYTIVLQYFKVVSCIQEWVGGTLTRSYYELLDCDRYF